VLAKPTHVVPLYEADYLAEVQAVLATSATIVAAKMLEASVTIILLSKNLLITVVVVPIVFSIVTIIS